MTFATLVHDARTKAGLTQMQVASRCEMEQARLSKIENGHERPSAAQLARLVEVLALEPAEALRLVGS